MPKRIEELLRAYRGELETATGYRVKKVILYGSYARGDFRPDSDIDVMVLVDTDMGLTLCQWCRATHILIIGKKRICFIEM